MRICIKTACENVKIAILEVMNHVFSSLFRKIKSILWCARKYHSRRKILPAYTILAYRLHVPACPFLYYANLTQ